MQRIELEVKPRDLGDKNTKKNLTQLRQEGWIPGSLYGNGKPVEIAIDAKTFGKAIHTKAGTNALFNVKFGTETSLSVIKEVQRHVLKHNPIHVDFQRINTKEKLSLNIPTHVVGEAPGVKNSGGILEHITREVRVRCLPEDIPVSIDIDVSKLELGHGIKVKDLPSLKGVEYLTNADIIVVNIVAQKVEEEKAATTEAAAAGAQPEVIAKGKKEEEGAAAPAAGGAAAKPAAAPAAKAAPASKEEKKK
ncbi:MAG: 50S ribosomal protein L25 [Elusimicrobia bacterium]|nr:50S ribosomal protein L25 [Elusimicrobiota bacterium]